MDQPADPNLDHRSDAVVSRNGENLHSVRIDGGGRLGFVPKSVAEAAKAFDSQQPTREKPKFLANSATTYDPCRV
ncbi:hypothetical protein Mal15_00570 [Stieleria maiorica]|uniref:Uncharacterized protein n=1 Tax=Stieleria maiorica TaxID=2795974 RepID=A0A5B9M4H8_9BACT|nr:hypothetical protein Mal15_00570 [Stieleria maiorica]